MYNIKGIAVATDGTMKRIAVTYDEIDDEGTITSSNNKTNRVITDEDVLSAVTTLEEYAESIIG